MLKYLLGIQCFWQPNPVDFCKWHKNALISKLAGTCVGNIILFERWKLFKERQWMNQ